MQWWYEDPTGSKLCPVLSKVGLSHTVYTENVSYIQYYFVGSVKLSKTHECEHKISFLKP